MGTALAVVGNGVAGRDRSLNGSCSSSPTSQRPICVPRKRDRRRCAQGAAADERQRDDRVALARGAM